MKEKKDTQPNPPSTCIDVHHTKTYNTESMACLGGGGVLRFPETSQNWAGARARASS